MVSADSVFKAIAHPTRRGIISLLAIGARSVKELTAEFEISQPAISQHLKELRDASLVSSDRVGLEQRYNLTPRPLKYVVGWTDNFRILIDPSGHAWSFVPQSGKQRKQRVRKRERHGR
ncbi:MAG: metalloregulator ArsR/SmtB family transcription factor [Candidatus Acidiferrales bacterium]